MIKPRTYVIYSISNSPYQQWQADLLDYSFKKVKQPGTLIRLCSQDSQFPNRDVPVSKAGITLSTPNFSQLGSELDWPIMNKVGSLCHLFELKYFREFDTLIFLDPDMIFLKPWNPKVEPGTAYGQKWKGYGNNYCRETSIEPDLCPENDEACLMYPFAIGAGDMAKLPQDIKYFALEGYKKCNDWMADMSAFVIAMVKHGITMKTVDNLGICNNWDNRNDENAPIMHYCKPILNKEQKEIWGKWAYRPWNALPSPDQATNRVDRELLLLLEEYRLTPKSRRRPG